MTFTSYLLERSTSIWDQYYTHPFIQEVGLGTLPKEKFKHYLIQDFLYLKEYAKVFCAGVIKAKTMNDMKFFYHSIKGTMEDETAIHLEYMKKLGVPAHIAEMQGYDLITSSYTSYMQAIALTKEIEDIAVATLACTWSYSVLGHYLKNNFTDQLNENYYEDWINMYSDVSFDTFTHNWLTYIDALCENISENRKEELLEIFIKCSIYELQFWDMAYEEVIEEDI